MGTAVAVLSSTMLGLAVSTSLCLVGAVIGVGMVGRLVSEDSELNVSMLKKIVGWAATIPLAMIVSVLVFKGIMLTTKALSVIDVAMLVPVTPFRGRSHAFTPSKCCNRPCNSLTIAPKHAPQPSFGRVSSMRLHLIATLLPLTASFASTPYEGLQGLDLVLAEASRAALEGPWSSSVTPTSSITPSTR